MSEFPSEFKCSVCGWYSLYRCPSDGYYYCPDCGAKMDGSNKNGRLDGTISIEQNEYRPCTVDGKKALFHRWYEFNDVVDAGLTIGSHPAGQLKFLYAIVEYEDGTIEEVAPPKVKFSDGMCTKKWFESEAEKE